MKLELSAEVSKAVKQRLPLVALETSVVAQGLPPPENLKAARACEDAIRQRGATPATTAVIDGVVHVGLTAEQLEQLGRGGGELLKLGSRDLAVAVAKKRTGGTTVSATCEIAHAAGIRVFSTGGIGGVHRGVAEHWDISQDLWALSKFPVAVVCAGAKSVLDLPKTLEALESLAVPVVGVRTHELPSFYSTSSGLPLEHRVENADEAAELLRARVEVLKQGGMVFALPPPEDSALAQADVEKHVQRALAAAKEQKISGKAVTPFLLKELSSLSSGESLRANLDLLVNNARFAADLAVALVGQRPKKGAVGFGR